jgi:riboflavin synthase
MFTGIIQAIGTLRALEPRGGDLRLRLDTGRLPLDAVELGDSIAVNGICLTVVRLNPDGFTADVSRETLGSTTLGSWRSGTRVNLEKALTLSTPLGGHLVSGHVDGVGRVLKRSGDGRSIRLRIEAPADLARYIAQKGSICVDGISLTVNRVEGRHFELNIVPHTLQETTLVACGEGAQVNLEVDLIARYLERLMLGERASRGGSGDGVSERFLAEHGFLR